MKNVFLGVGFFVFGLSSCQKASDWLNEPRSKKDVTFEKLKDYQELLNNTSVFNLAMPGVSIIGTDNIYIRDEAIQSLAVVERNAYLWNKDIFEGRSSIDYTGAYQAINYSNVILAGIEEVVRNDNNKALYNEIKGQALFFRALMYSELANLFCKPFDQLTANVDKGICIRLNPDINSVVPRSSVLETYAQILGDIKTSIDLLQRENKIKTRPTKVSAYLLLARVNLLMSNYIDAKRYADSVLAISDLLIDFNSAPNINLPYRFPDFNSSNSEIVFYAQGFPYSVILPGNNINLALVDTFLYRSYNENDLRKMYFYSEIDSSTIKFKEVTQERQQFFLG